MTDDSEKRLAAIAERLEKATPGRWELTPGDQTDPLIIVVKDPTNTAYPLSERRAVVLGYDIGDGDSEPGYIVREEDAALIANAPADLAWALAVIDELRGDATRIDGLQEALDDGRSLVFARDREAADWYNRAAEGRGWISRETNGGDPRDIRKRIDAFLSAYHPTPTAPAEAQLGNSHASALSGTARKEDGNGR